MTSNTPAARALSCAAHSLEARNANIAAAALLAAIVAAGCTVRPDDFIIDGQDLEVVFLHSGDIHSRLIPYEMDVGETDKALGLLQENAPFGGIARLSWLVRQERLNNERFAYLESGDVYQGAPIFNQFRGQPEFIAMTNLGVDAFAIGNHEFDNGAQPLVERARQYANFPMLASNYAYDDPDRSGNASTAMISQPYAILNLKGLRVGVIGLGSTSSMRSIFQGKNSLGITPLHTRETVQKYVDILRPQVDLVVVLGHLGYHDDLEFIPRTEGIDIVFDGHLHIALDPPNVLQDCDVAMLRRERDKYRCDTPEKLRQVQRGCEVQKLCDREPAAAQPACRDACAKEAVERCAHEQESFNYKGRMHELDQDIEALERRGCHPRNVLLVHSGAFLKFAGRLQVTVRQCTRLEQREVCVEKDDLGRCVASRPRRCAGRSDGRNDWEVIAHKYDLIPIDSRMPQDPMMVQLIEPYLFELNRQNQLTQVIGYTPNRVRRFSTGAGDSQLGNMVADAMQLRQQVWADFAVTNSLGIRSDMVIGPVDQEQMTNIFPFENSITLMYLSGYEVQELMDFITQRSTFRGCQSQAQVAGITAVLNCGGCSGTGENECTRVSYNGDACAQRVTIGGTGRPCLRDEDCSVCAAPDGAPAEVQEAVQRACADRDGAPMREICTGQRHPEYEGYKRCWQQLTCSRSYKLSTNDYIARGGSGFQILERNTTQENLGIGLRQAAVDFMRAMPSCGERPPRSGYMFGQKSESVLSEAERAQLETLEAFAERSDWNEVNEQFFAMATELRARREASDDGLLKAGLTNYLYCSDLDCSCRSTADCSATGGGTCARGFCVKDGNTRCNGLAFRLVSECRDFKDTNLDQCEALGRVHAARRCLTLPCINSKEDGRLDRILKDSSGSPNPFEPWPD